MVLLTRAAADLFAPSHPDVAAYLRTTPGARDRSAPWHLTVSVVVLSGDLVLLGRHPRWGWKQFGGHLEQVDDSLEAASLRELREEAGIRAHEPRVARVTPFFGPMCGDPAGAHLDVCFWVEHPAGDATSPEGLDLEWFSLPAAFEVLDAGARDMLNDALALRRVH